jgi:DNA mismatch repair protein MutS2
LEIPDQETLLKKSERVLGWPELCLALAQAAASETARAICRELPLAVSRLQAEELLADTSEMAGLIQRGASPPLTAFDPVGKAVESARMNAVLAGEVLAQIAVILSQAQDLKKFFRDKKDPAPRLAAKAAGLEFCRDLLDDLNRSLDPKGLVKDTASATLKQLRNQHATLRHRMLTRLEKLLSDPDLAEHLQDRFYTMRGSRYVIPIKSEARPRFQGIVHDSSASGATLYLEPAEMVEANNSLRMIEIEIETEIQRILRELSREVKENAPAILMDERILTELDLLRAKARLSLELGGSRPELNDQGVIAIRQARHPLLALRHLEVVPNDVSLGGASRVLLISGPNAGGKTVCLKMVGLLALMARAGLFLPAAPDSNMAIFPQVFADIGDAQDISLDLSTYSGHVLNIIGILRATDPKSLVLLDEMVASTDPIEGVALAGALLRRLCDQAAITVATTHFGALKVFAQKQAGFVNGSFDFDLDTMKPSYRLVQGVPGRSLGIQIAAQLGLPAEIVAEAKGLLDQTQLQADELLSELEQQRKKLALELSDAGQERVRIRSMAEEYRERLQRMEAEEREFNKTVKARIREEVAKARTEVKKALGGLAKVKTPKEIEVVRRQVAEVERAIEAKLPVDELSEGAKPDLAELHEGDQVMVLPFRQEAVLLMDPDPAAGEKGTVRVRMGAVKLSVEAGALRELPKDYKPKKMPIKTWQEKQEKEKEADPSILPPAPTNSLDLRGQRAHEVETQVDQFLDEACRRRLPNVFIIHGHGTGALRQVIREYLPTSPYVMSFRAGEQAEGGDGVTMVVLKEIG